MKIRIILIVYLKFVIVCFFYRMVLFLKKGEKMKKGGIKKKEPDKIYSWINSPEGKEKLNSAYKRTKKIVDELVKSRYVDSETLHRPFNK